MSFSLRGGILTVGLQTRPQKREGGVYWSLPLALLRYYGALVTLAKSIGTHASRITMEQLLQVALGCVIKDWGLNLLDVAGFIVTMHDYITATLRPSADPPLDSWIHWLRLLALAANAFLDADTTNAKSCRRLIGFGERRCPTFLGPISERIPPLFGIRDINTYMSLLEDQETTIAALRDYAVILEREEDVKPDELIIRYKRSDSAIFEYATALAHPKRFSQTP